MSAILLPFGESGTVDWEGFTAHLERTAAVGLTPAVNMDTGYVQAIDPATRIEVLDRTAASVGGAFVAGAFVDDAQGAALDTDAYLRAAADIAVRGGTPVIFPSWGLAAATDEHEDAVVDLYTAIGAASGRLIGFELGAMFVPWGRIYTLATYQQILDVPECIGAKHSSLSRTSEWDRLALRDEHREDFLVLTGNDLAIDMVMYGSDYLLGLSTCAPDLFARRDVMWEEGDDAFFELNDRLQYLGHFAFRDPVPAYKHDAAMFLRLRGWIDSDAPPPGELHRPDSDREILATLAADLGVA